jgi:hypothetical protein
MCFPRANKQNQFKPTPPPEKAAEPLEVGSAREAEDEALFGGQPNLSVNRDSLGKGVAKSGTGLRMM